MQGFIGSNLVKRLLLDNNEIHVFDNFSTGRRENLPINNKLFIHEIDLKNSFNKWPIISADEIFHLSALMPM